jgi:hypothetical protein
VEPEAADRALSLIAGRCSTCRRDSRYRLLVVDRLVPDRADESAHHRRAYMIDLHMMVILGGRDRNEGEFLALFDASGPRLTRTIDAASCP